MLLYFYFCTFEFLDFLKTGRFQRLKCNPERIMLEFLLETLICKLCKMMRQKCHEIPREKSRRMVIDVFFLLELTRVKKFPIFFRFRIRVFFYAIKI